MNTRPTKLRARTGAIQKCHGLAAATVEPGSARKNSSTADMASSYRRTLANPDAKVSDRRLGGRFVPDRPGDPTQQVGRHLVLTLLGDQDPQLHLKVKAPRTGGAVIEVAGDGGTALVGQRSVEVVVDLVNRLVAVQSSQSSGPESPIMGIASGP